MLLVVFAITADGLFSADRAPLDPASRMVGTTRRDTTVGASEILHHRCARIYAFDAGVRISSADLALQDATFWTAPTVICGTDDSSTRWRQLEKCPTTVLYSTELIE